jgi:cytochrome c-type biogenesis protein CcmH/NrfG
MNYSGWIPTTKGDGMTVAELSWPQASVYITLIVAAGLVLAVLIWSIFRTGQAAIRVESRRRDELDGHETAAHPAQ